jgi:hypothetical protein
MPSGLSPKHRNPMTARSTYGEHLTGHHRKYSRSPNHAMMTTSCQTNCHLQETWMRMTHHLLSLTDHVVHGVARKHGLYEVARMVSIAPSMPKISRDEHDATHLRDASVCVCSAMARIFRSLPSAGYSCTQAGRCHHTQMRSYPLGAQLGLMGMSEASASEMVSCSSPATTHRYNVLRPWWSSHTG